MPARASQRGAAHHAFRLIFSVPFDESVVRSYRMPGEGVLTEQAPGPVARGRWRTIGGVGALGLAAVSATAGALLVRSSRHWAADAKTAPDQEQAATLNGRVSTRNQQAAVAFGLGGAAAITGALLLLLPEAGAGGPWLCPGRPGRPAAGPGRLVLTPVDPVHPVDAHRLGSKRAADRGGSVI
jgi:hypothetical protein